MKLSISTGWDYRVPLEESLRQIRIAGFRTISLGGKVDHSGYGKPEGRARIRKLCDQMELVIDSVHAPFGTLVDISSPEDVLRHSAVVEIKRAINACAELGAKVLIFHLSGFGARDVSARLPKVRESITKLLEVAKSRGVRLAAENLGDENSHILLKYAFEIFDDDFFGLCFDNGHAELNKDEFTTLEKYGRRLHAIHLHDNDGKSDQHLIPFSGKANIPNLAAKLNKLPGICPVTIESDVSNSEFTTPSAFLSRAYESGQKFLEMLKPH